MTNLRCYQCGSALDDLKLPLGRLDQCRACGRYVHACRMCSHYDPAETSKQCTEDDAEKVHDKVNANFCDFFSPSAEAYAGGGYRAERKARAELDALFGRTSEASGTAQEDTSDALKAARALFDE